MASVLSDQPDARGLQSHLEVAGVTTMPSTNSKPHRWGRRALCGPGQARAQLLGGQRRRGEVTRQGRGVPGLGQLQHAAMQGLEASSEKCSRLASGGSDRVLAIYNEVMMLDGRCWVGFHKEKMNFKPECCLTTESGKS